MATYVSAILESVAPPILSLRDSTPLITSSRMPVAPLVPVRLSPAEAGGLGGSTLWCLGVLAAYASRAQPEALLSFVVAARPSRALAEAAAKQATVEVFGTSLARAGRAHALLELYKAAPLDMRSDALVDTVLDALSRLGRMEEVSDVISDVSRAALSSGRDFSPYIITARSNSGRFTGADGALAYARKLAIDRAETLSRNSPAPRGQLLTSAPFDACMVAAGVAGAPHYARAIFECLATCDYAHTSSYSADSTAAHVAAACDSAFREEEKSTMAPIASLIVGLPSLTLMARGNTAQKSEHETLFSALRSLREAGEVALTPASYIALIEAYGMAGNGQQAAAVWMLLKHRCEFEQEVASRNRGSSSGGVSWALPAAGAEAVLAAQVRACSHSRKCGRALPAGLLSYLECDDIFHDMVRVTSVNSRGLTAEAAASVAALIVYRGEPLDHFLSTLKFSELDSHPIIIAAICEAHAVLAEAAIAVNKDAIARNHTESALSLHTSHFTKTAAAGTSVVFAAQCSAMMLAFVSSPGGMISECRKLINEMAQSELEPCSRDFCTVVRGLTGRIAPSDDVVTLCRALTTLDKNLVGHTGLAAAWLATAEALTTNISFASELLNFSSRSSLNEPSDLLRSFIILVDATAAAAASSLLTGSQKSKSLSLRHVLTNILHSNATRALLEEYSEVASPTVVQAAESRCARRVYDTVRLADDVNTRRQALLPDTLQLTDRRTLLFENFSQNSAAVNSNSEGLREASVILRVTDFIREAHLAFSALIASAQDLSEASEFFNEATQFLREKSYFVRVARVESAAELERHLENLTGIYKRRVACVDMAKIFEAPYSALLSCLTRAREGSTASIRLVSGREMTLPAGGLTAVIAWCAAIDEDVIVPTHCSATIALYALNNDNVSSSASVESHVMRQLCEAVSRGFTTPSLHPVGNFVSLVRCNEASQDVIHAVSLSDTVIPLRLSLAAAVRNGPLVVQLWQSYLSAKASLATNGFDTPLPFSNKPTTEAISCYLTALAVVAESGGDDDSADAADDIMIDQRLAPVAQPLATNIVLNEARTTLCSVAADGRTSRLSDVLCLVRIYVSAGLLPDARVLLRMVLAPVSGRDYTQSALSADVEKDARSLSESLGTTMKWPGQDVILHTGISSAGLAFGASAWLLSTSSGVTTDLVAASIAARSVTESALPLDSAAFCDLAITLSACGLASDLPALIDYASNMEINFVPRVNSPARFIILDRLAGIAAYSAFAMDGNMVSAEATLSDSRFNFNVLADAPVSRPLCLATDAALSAMLRRPAMPTTMLVPQRGATLADGQKAVRLVQTLRILGYATNGRVHRALRLLERSVLTHDIMPMAISAVLVAASRLSSSDLLIEPPADFRQLELDNPYTTARKLLGGSTIVSSRVAAGASSLSYATASVLSRLEAVAGAASTPSASNASWWSLSSIDVSSIVRIYTNAGRPMVAIALAWNHIATVLRARQALVSATLGDGIPHAAWNPVYLEAIEELLEDAHALSRLSHVHDDGTGARRARARQAAVLNTMSMDDESIAAAAAMWGLHRTIGGMHPHLPPRPHDAATMETHFIPPSLLEALAAAYTVAPADSFASGVVPARVLSLIALVSTILRVPLTNNTELLFTTVNTRLRTLGALSITSSSSLPTNASLPLPPSVFFSQALSTVGFMTQQFTPLPPVASAGDVTIGSRISRPSVWAAQALAPAATLASPVLQSFFASIGYRATQPVRQPSVECRILFARVCGMRFTAIGTGVHDSEANDAEARFTASVLGLMNSSTNTLSGTEGIDTTSTMVRPLLSSSFLTSVRLQPLTQISALPLSLESSSHRNVQVRALETEVLGLSTELENLTTNINDAENRVAAEAFARYQGPSAPPRSSAQLKIALEALTKEADSLQDKAAMVMDSRSLLVNWRECGSELEAEDVGLTAEIDRSINEMLALESLYTEAVARYESFSAEGVTEGVAALQALVVGPAAVRIVEMQTVRLRIAGSYRAQAEDMRRAATEKASVYACEADTIILRNSLTTRRIALMQRNVTEFRDIEERINNEMKSEEERLRTIVRALREAVRAATAGGASSTRHGQQPTDPLWSEAIEKVKAAQLVAQCKIARKELEVRVTASSHVSNAVENARIEGSQLVNELRERYMKESSAITAEYRSKAELAVEKLGLTLSAELKPMLAASQASALKDSARLTQLRHQAFALDAEVTRLTQPPHPGPTSLFTQRGSGPDFGLQFSTVLSDIADSSSARDSAMLAFSIIDDILPSADLDGALDAIKYALLKAGAPAGLTNGGMGGGGGNRPTPIRSLF